MKPCPTASCLLLVACIAGPVARADCIDEAAQQHRVNGHVLRAIGWHESRLRAEALARNRNGTWDIGAFQINSIHLALLARHGIDARALADGCTSAHVAAWHYARQVTTHGNTWRAVGAYHSHTPARSAWYANAIAQVLMRWRVLPNGPLPFNPASTLAPRRTAPASTAPEPADASPSFDAGASDPAPPPTDPPPGGP